MRRFLYSTVIVGVLALVWGVGVEPGLLRVRVTRVPVVGLAQALRVALISDTHEGSPGTGCAQIDRVIAATNAQSPDAVLLLGDYLINGVIGGNPVGPEHAAAHFVGLAAPVFAVIGNHDAWNCADCMASALAANGVTVLRNRVVVFHGVTIVGLDDPYGLGSDVNTIPRTPGALVLVHNPDAVEHMHGPVGLVVAGHTHGGQVRLPLWGAVVEPTNVIWADGLSNRYGQTVFVTPGIGTSVLPIRLDDPPTVDILDLVPG